MDPKLQETYNRIMNTPTSPAPSTNTTPLSPPSIPEPIQSSTPSLASPLPSTENMPLSEQQPLTERNGTVAPQESVNPYAFQPDSPSTFAIAGQPPMQEQTVAMENTNQVPEEQQTSSLVKIIYVVGAIVFFIAYTIFWIKIFKLPIPLPF